MKTHKVIIIGSGFGGQCSAINLERLKINDYIILERRSFMGGTWCQNTYPGAAVDVQSPLYSLSFEPYPWTQMFAEQKELETYTKYVIDKYNLRDKTLINTNVSKVIWSEADKTWSVHTSENKIYKGEIIINATGPLSTSIIPNFKGKEHFKGKSFHTNNWDNNYDYTGKRVGIIGSGASAIQVIPAIAPSVKKLHVFQRTPHWIMPRPDYTFSKFQRKLLGINWFYKMIRSFIYWALETRVIGFKYSRLFLNLIGRNKALRLIKNTISDPELRKKVSPDYTIGCKRVLLSNTIYPTYNRDNVELHTKEEGIEEITSTGITTKDGQQIALDLIVYATGFDASDGLISYPVVGKNKVALTDFWNAFPRAYLGTSVPGFPNFFIVTGPNTGIGHTSAIFIIEAQMRYIMKCIKSLEEKKKNAIEVNVQAEEEYTKMIHKEMEKTVWHTGGCNSWYKSKSGYVVAVFPGFSFTYLRLAKKFKADHHSYS